MSRYGPALEILVLIAYAQMSLTLCILMDFPKHIDTINMGLPILYFKGSQVDYDIFLSLS